MNKTLVPMLKPGFLWVWIISIAWASCQFNQPRDAFSNEPGYDDIRIAGAMRNVMRKGELGGVIHLDSLTKEAGWYGVGPVEYLQGELMLFNGVGYVSRVASDSTMVMEKTGDVKAPFFVYARVLEWEERNLPDSIVTDKQLEHYLHHISAGAKRPFAFKLRGEVADALFHVQNLPPGSTVSSPEEAHRGQVKYRLQHEDVHLLGFFSTEHQGVFTHHDSYVHMHLLTADEQMMGHLDGVSFKAGGMKLYLPVH